MEKVTYRMLGLPIFRMGDRPTVMIEECLNGHAVNLYKAYNDGKGSWVMFPERQITPSVVDLKKKSIAEGDAKRNL